MTVCTAYVVVALVCDRPWCHSKLNRTIEHPCAGFVSDGGTLEWSAVRAHLTQSPASAYATRLRKLGVAAEVREVYPLEAPRVKGTPEERYEAAERAIEAVGLRAAEAQALARAIVVPKKPRRKRVECRNCLGSGDDNYRWQDNASGPGTPATCTNCGGKGTVLR